MNDKFSLIPSGIVTETALQEIHKCNTLTKKFGLTLSDAAVQNIMKERTKSLKDSGRIEFGTGIMPKLIYAFCDSPYITQDNYEDVLIELQNSFYYFKNESEDLISDDELIEFMSNIFNNKAHGSIEYLSETSLEELCRNTRYGFKNDR